MFKDITSHQRDIFNRNIALQFGQNIQKADDFNYIGASEDELELFELVKAYDEDLEKARNVGDLFFRDGKTYIWTEYAPGKFCWHVYNKKNKVEGKGINGVKGVKALQKTFEDIDKTYTDTTKFLLQRTPNGNWRLHYDGNDTGMTIAGDAITESELQEGDICFKDRRCVDNFELLKGYMEFNSPDDVYFVQIIKRWKDNKDKPDAEAWRTAGKQKGTYNSGAEYLDYWLIHSPAELDAVKSQIIKICSYNNARAYISINSRSQSQVNNFISKFQSRFSPNDPRVQHAEAILYGQAKTGPAWRNERLKVLLDIDTVRETEVTIPGTNKKVNVWDEIRRRLKSYGIKVAAEYETPSGGLHLILNNKNNRNLRPFYAGLSDFDGGRHLGMQAMVHPSEDIKMILYSNVATEGY